MNAVVVLLISTLAALTAAADVIYCSPNGAGAGTKEDPCDLATAFTKVSSRQDEVRLLKGTYAVGSVAFPPSYSARLTGDGAKASDVVLDGEGAGSSFNLRGGGQIANVTFSNYTDSVVLDVGAYNDGIAVVTNCEICCCTCNSQVALKLAGNQGVLVVDSVVRDVSSKATYGCAVHCSTSKAHLLRTLLANNRAVSDSWSGAAAFYSNQGDALIEDCVVSNNYSVKKGIIYTESVGILIKDTRFYGNESPYGAICGTSGTQTNRVEGCTFVTNTAYCGGAIALREGLTYVTNCTFRSNVASSNGGAIYGDGTGTGIIEDSVFADNAVPGKGGAVQLECYGADVAIRRCTFRGNHASQYGGAICNSGPTYIGQCIRYSITDSLFENNYATLGGALGQDYNGNARIGAVAGITNCVFRGNYARQGGAVNGHGLTFYGCLFETNSTVTMAGSSAGAGGAILCYARGYNRASVPEATNHFVVIGCTFRGNTTPSSGSGLCGSERTTYTVTDTLFEDNAAGGGTGGAISIGNTANYATIERCRFVRNSGGAYGQGIGFYSSSVLKSGKVRNCLFLCNTNTSDYAGALVPTVNCEIDSCLFIRNVTTGAGGAIWAQGTTGPVRNCLFLGNRLTWSTGASDCDILGDAMRKDGTYHCCTDKTAFPSERGNIVCADPKFCDEAAGDFRLRKDSPCVNVGTNLEWMVGATDLSGRRRYARILYGTTDIGAFEFREPQGLAIMVK